MSNCEKLSKECRRPIMHGTYVAIIKRPRRFLTLHRRYLSSLKTKLLTQTGRFITSYILYIIHITYVGSFVIEKRKNFSPQLLEMPNLFSRRRFWLMIKFGSDGLCVDFLRLHFALLCSPHSGWGD